MLLTGLVTSACAPRIHKAGAPIVDPLITQNELLVADGTRLPMRKWMPSDQSPKAVLLAVHGFNDYSNYFKAPGQFFAKNFGFASYAIDQRGFGAAPPELGVWAGAETYADDLKSAAIALKKEHPDLPLYILGASMGGGILMVAMTDPDMPDVDGIILSAPAVWARVTMPWYQRLALWIGAHTFPEMTLSGRGLNIKPSDNIPMLVELGKDPLIIKETRIGTIHGLVNLMDLALQRSSQLDAPALILYGENDEVIPKKPTVLMLDKLPDGSKDKRRIALYEKGFHMLLRDLQRETVWQDIGVWMKDRSARLPSGADRRDLSILARN